SIPPCAIFHHSRPPQLAHRAAPVPRFRLGRWPAAGAVHGKEAWFRTPEVHPFSLLRRGHFRGGARNTTLPCGLGSETGRLLIRQGDLFRRSSRTRKESRASATAGSALRFAGRSKPVNEAPDWRAKYRAAIDQLEAETRAWKQLEDVLRRLVRRLCLAANGIDARLDEELRAVAAAMRTASPADAIEQLLGRLTTVVVAFDASRAGTGQYPGLAAGPALPVAALPVAALPVAALPASESPVSDWTATLEGLAE